MNRTFDDKPAVRESVPLLLGIVGPSGSGKTWSALRLATGIQQVVGGTIFGIDTEGRRMLHYSDYFKFRHVDFGAPFGSLDYLACIQQQAAKGAKTIIVDSASHEHEGPGGMIDFHEHEFQRMGGRDAVKMLAWVKPKQARRALINGILQLPCNFIFCFRAKHISKPVKVNGKTEVIDQGFVPVSGDEFVYEMACNIFLPPGSKGVPAWQSERPGESMAMKLPQQFRDIFASREPLSEDIGRKLAEWAKGGAASPEPDPLLAAGRVAAGQGTHVLTKWWESLPKAAKAKLKGVLDTELKPAAMKADEPPEPPLREPGWDDERPDNEKSGRMFDDEPEAAAVSEGR